MAVTHAVVVPGLQPADHRPHPLHGPALAWVEKNCYTDVWIELLHAQGLDPHAMLPFVFALDFEGDQWTFFKPPLAELRALYGVDVQELTVWRPFLDHALEHLGAGKWLAVEVDAYGLPDTAGTDYRHAHAKTTIVLNEVDTAARRVGYFHNAGYHVLDGEDYDLLFAAPLLPPYAEVIRLDRVVRRDADELKGRSTALFEQHLAWRPADNPVVRYAARFEADLPGLQAAGLATYHRWAFAGLRQLGAAAELAAIYLDWLSPSLAPNSAESFRLVAQLAKTLTLKAARSVNSGKALDARATLDQMATAWAAGMAAHSRSTENQSSRPPLPG